MPITHNSHQQASPGVELRNYEYAKFATVAAMNLVTGRPGEICTVTATGVDYQWNQTLTAWVPWHNNGSVLRQNITGAATANVAGRGAAELTLTGNVTGLTISGWSTDNTIVQRVRFQIIQDGTGGRSFAWASVSGIWLETPPSTLDTTPAASSLQFYAITTDGGTTVWLEPIGITYVNNCSFMQVNEVVLPSVTAGGTVTVSHSYSLVYGVELIEVATGRRIMADWYQASASASAAVNIDFTDSHPANTYRVRIGGVSNNPCQLSVTTSEWVTLPLSVAAATTSTATFTYTGTAGSMQILYGDGTAAQVVTSGAAISHTYGSAYTGNITLRWRRGTTLTQIVDGVTPWTFNVSVLPSSLTRFTVAGAVTGDIATLPSSLTILGVFGTNTLSGSLGGLPAGLTFLQVAGSNTIAGSVASLPAGVTFFQLTGNNTTSGSIASLPAGLTTYINQGNNTTSGSIASLPAGLTNFTNQGNNTTSGSIASLPAGLTTYDNQGSNTTSGSVASLPSGLTVYFNSGLNTTSGSVSALPAGLKQFWNTGSNTTSGDISALPVGLTYFNCFGSNTVSLTGGYSPPAGLTRFSMRPAGGFGLTSAMVDTVLVAIDALGTSTGGPESPDIDLSGNNATPTAAGLAAKTALIGRGWTVLTN